AQVPLQRAAVDVEAGADLVPDHDGEGLALVEVGDFVGRGRSGKQADGGAHRKGSINRVAHDVSPSLNRGSAPALNPGWSGGFAASTTAGGKADTRAMNAATSSPVVGWMSICVLAASVRPRRCKGRRPGPT